MQQFTQVIYRGMAGFQGSQELMGQLLQGIKIFLFFIAFRILLLAFIKANGI